MKTEEIIRIIILVLFSSVFIVVFYFTYAQTVEKKILEKQFADVTHEIMGDVMQLVPSEFSGQVNQLLSDIKAPTSSDESIVKQNNELIGKTKTFLTIFAIVVLFILIFLIKRCDLSSDKLKSILKDDLVLLGFVALTEYLFLTFITSKFICFDINTVKYALINTIQNNVNKSSDDTELDINIGNAGEKLQMLASTLPLYLIQKLQTDVLNNSQTDVLNNRPTEAPVGITE